MKIINTNFTTIDSIFLKSKLAKVLLCQEEIFFCEIIIEDLVKSFESFFEIYYDTLIDFLVFTNQFDRAIKLTNRYLFDLDKAFSLGKICKGLILHGKIKKAFELVELFKDEIGLDYLHRDIILALLEKGEISLVKEHINKIGDELYFLKNDIIIKIIIKLIEKKNVSTVENLLEEFIELDSSCIYQICIEFIKVGLIEKAFNISKKITGIYYKALFDYYNNVNNEIYNPKYIDK